MSSTAARDLPASVFPDPGLALEQQRLWQTEAEVHRCGEALVDEVVDAREPLGQGLYVRDEVADLARRVTGHSQPRPPGRRLGRGSWGARPGAPTPR